MPATEMAKRLRRFAIGLGLALVSLLLVCGLLEAMLRFLPVSEGLRTVAVTRAAPVTHFEPNREVLWSRFADFSMQNRVRVNNAGFVSNIDYDADATGPLLAVVGDSFVEAVMVPWAETVHGRLAERLAGGLRVYSFGASGAALSQHLAYARHVRDVYHPSKGLVVVIGNDFDESLPQYKHSPGLHVFRRGAGGQPELEVVEYAPSTASLLVRHSRLLLYLVHNLEVLGAAQRLRQVISPGTGFVGQTDAEASEQRLRDGRFAADAFVALLPESFGLSPQDIMLVVDAPRPEVYDPAALLKAKDSYFVQMREHLLARARQAGLRVIDLAPVMAEEYAAHGERFEFPRDAHWNGRGHQVAAEAVLRSGFLGAVPGVLQGSGPNVGTSVLANVGR